MKKSDGLKYGLIIGLMIPAVLDGRAQNGAWTRKANAPLLPGSACVLNGKIHVMGGTGKAPDYTDQATNEVYDPVKDTWDTLQPMPTPRGFLSTATVNDTVYAIGGGYPVARDCVELYDPLTDTWTSKTKMLGPRLGARAVVVDGIIYNIGGNYFEKNCEAYDPGTDSWTRKSDRPESGGVLSATVYEGIIYTFGGSSYVNDYWAAFSNVYAYNPHTDTWTKKKDMPTARFAFQTYLVGGKIYALAGSRSSGTSLATVEMYDPVKDTWTSESDMPLSLAWPTGAVVNDRIYVIGGTSDWQDISTEVWEYDPFFNTGLMVIKPALCDFQNVRCGSASDTLAVVMWNRASIAMQVDSLFLGRTEFRIPSMPTLPLVVPPCSETSLKVVFTPALAGVVVWDTLVIHTSDTLDPRKAIPLRGRGSDAVRRAQAEVLYGISSSPGAVGLYDLDRSSGAGVLAATFSPRPPPGLCTFAVRPADTTMYAAFSSAGITELYRLSSEFGDLEPFSTIPLGAVTAMAFSADDGLFAVTSRARLYRVEPGTSDTIFVGSTGYPFTGLAFSPATGALWASTHDTVCTVDTASGAVTVIGWSGWSCSRSSIAFSGLGVLYGLYGAMLVTIGKVWGEARAIGATEVPDLVAIAMRSDASSVDVAHVPDLPRETRLYQNFPNPFNSTTTIRFDLPGHARAQLRVYDILGREVAVLTAGEKPAGSYSVQFDASELGSGLYICRMRAGSTFAVRKMLLLK